MTYHRRSSRFYPNSWDIIFSYEDDVMVEEERLQEEYPNAKIYVAQDEYHPPYDWYLSVEFKDVADEAEFILKESL